MGIEIETGTKIRMLGLEFDDRILLFFFLHRRIRNSILGHHETYLARQIRRDQCRD